MCSSGCSMERGDVAYYNHDSSLLPTATKLAIAATAASLLKVVIRPSLQGKDLAVILRQGGLEISFSDIWSKEWCCCYGECVMNPNYLNLSQMSHKLRKYRTMACISSLVVCNVSQNKWESNSVITLNLSFLMRQSLKGPHFWTLLVRI